MDELGVVYRDITRADRAATDALAGLGVATVHEAQGRVGLLHRRLRPIGPAPAVSGTAVTVLLQPGDNWMMHVAIEQVQPGDLVVAAVTSPSFDGFVGDLLVTALLTRGARGLVIDAGVRDVAVITDMGFPVWATAVSARGTVKATLGSVNVPIVCGDVLVRPGDAIVADEDGVVRVPAATVTETLTAAHAREDRETQKRARLAAGELGLDIDDMRPALAAAGLRYLDGPPR